MKKSRIVLLAVVVIIVVISAFVYSQFSGSKNTFNLSISWPDSAQSFKCLVYEVKADQGVSPMAFYFAKADMVIPSVPPLQEFTTNRPSGAQTQNVELTVGSGVTNVAVEVDYYSNQNAQGTVVGQSSYSVGVGKPQTSLLGFSFYYQFEPSGYHYWCQVGPNTWTETFPDTPVKDSFRVTSHGELDGVQGTFVQRINRSDQTGVFEVFFSDPNQSMMGAWFRHNGNAGTWGFLAV